MIACPKCTSSRIEEVMSDVTVISNINSINIEDDEISIDYGEQSNEGGTLECYQCADCGNTIAADEDELKEIFS